MSRNSGRNSDGTFARGNPGKPKGARHRVTRALEELLDAEADAITRKAIELAKEGDAAALRLVLERIIPPRKDRPVGFTLPVLHGAADAARGAAAIAEAVAAGDLTPGEAVEIAKVLDIFVRSLLASEFEERLAALERAKEEEQ